MIAARVLYLVPTDANDYVNFHAARFKEVFEESRTFNYVAHFFEHGLSTLPEAVLAAARDMRADAMVLTQFADCFHLTPRMLLEIKRASGVRLALLTFDDEQYFNSLNKYFAQAADGVVTTDWYAARAYEQLGIPAVHYFSSYPADVYRPMEMERDIDVSFVGNCAKNDRMAMVEHLRRAGVDVRLFGPGSDAGYVSESEMVEVFNRSKINLNFSKLDAPTWINADEPLLRRVRQNKGRPIEVAMTGSFCLSEYAPTLGKLFVPGKEVDSFTNPESLLAKVRHYLAHDAEREAMAKAAHARAVGEYEAGIYLPRVLARLFDKMDASPAPRDSEMLLSRGFAFRRSALFTFYAAIMLSRGKWAEALHILGRTARPLSAFLPGLGMGLVLAARSLGRRLAGSLKSGRRGAKGL